jgi:heat shock gene repressor HrcA
MMDLDERKRHILKALINDYIITAEPVGSRTIAKRYDLGISSATIRNEMADLEDMGYLAQPHTSAGRIPSDKGYRVYVDHLMGGEELSRREIEIIRDSIYSLAAGEIERVIKDASKLLSALTNYTALVMTPQSNKSAVKHIQLIGMESTIVMAIVVTNLGIVRNAMIRLSKPITGDKLNMINNILNDKLRGLTVEDINLNVISDVQRDMTGYNEILNDIIPVLTESLNYVENSEVHLEGSSNIFNFPEYNAIDRAKSFLSVLDKKDFLYKLLSTEGGSLKITIGHENEYDEISDCSLITAVYRIGDSVAGSIGVIGPTRMYYSRVLGVLKYVTQYLNEILTDYYADI